MLTNIIDGWALNPSIRYLPFRATPMMLGQLEPLRRAHNRRQWIVVLPDDLTVSIAARGQLNQQIRITPDSYLWGATFYRFTTEGPMAPQFVPGAPTELSLQITDDATGCQFGSEFINAQALYPNPPAITLPLNGGMITPLLLTQPRLFVKEGLLSVEIANHDSVEAFCQLALYFSEPCDKVLERNQCP